MNRKQAAYLLGVICLVPLIFLYPPYWIDGGLFGGTVYVYFRNPPTFDEQLFYYDTWLCYWELTFLFVSAITGLLALRSHANPRAITILWGGQILELLILGFSLPSFNGILVPEFTWLGLGLFAFVLFVVVLVVSVRTGT